jgi:alpha-N-arabinofuranosidase
VRAILGTSIIGLSALLLTGAPREVNAQETTPPAPVIATIDASKQSPPISKHLYGMFIEHIGSLINHGLWSEMVDDRKFYFPIKAEEPQPPGQQRAQAFRMRLNEWHPIGPDAFVTMDKDHAFVGEQSPLIRVEPSTPHGIRQSHLTLQKSKAYVGRVVIAGTPGAKVSVSLVWGPGRADRETISVATLHSSYATIPLKFTAKTDSPEGAFEVTGTGAGSFEIGAVSLMPADNLDGFRPEVIALLRQLNSGMWRLPGGNYISAYDWRSAVGDPDKRAPSWDSVWNAMQPNDVGMDELMTFCRLIHVDPYITVNAGFGDDHSAAEQVEYMNGSVHTPMGAWRARNGHPEPYHVKFWNIGNEPYGDWQFGHTALKYYVLKQNDFARAMRKVDPSITLLGSGAMPEEMTLEGQTKGAADVQAQFGSDYDWTGGFLAHSMGYFDGLTEHWYARAGKRFDFGTAKNGEKQSDIESGYIPATDESVDEWIRKPANRVRVKSEEWEEYKKRFPAIVEKKIFRSNDEYAYTGAMPNLKLTLAYAMTLNEMFRHTDSLKMAAFTMGTSTLDMNGASAAFNTTGLVFKLYRDHFGEIPVEVTGNSPQPSPRWPAGPDQPRVNAGSPTYPLDISAAFMSEKGYLTVAVVNLAGTAQNLTLNFKGVSLQGKSRSWQLTGPSLEAANHVGQPPQVEIVAADLPEVPHTVSVPANTVTVYQFPVAIAAQSAQ